MFISDKIDSVNRNICINGMNAVRNVETPILSCPTCNKEYKRRDFYKKHVLLCDLLQSSKHIDEEVNDIPNIRELYIMVQELGSKYATLKKEHMGLKHKLHLLEKEAKLESPDILPEEYLAKYKRCDVSFESWIKDISFTTKDVRELVDKHYLVVMSKIVKQNYDCSSPICGFKVGKKNRIMFYNNKYWEDLGNTEIKQLLDSLVQRVIANASVYDISPTEVCTIIQKLMNSTYNDHTYQDFRNHLFKEIQQTIHL